MLLGFLLEHLAGASLDAQWTARWASRPDAESHDWLGFNPPATMYPLIAPTELDPSRGGLIHGTVHDENTQVLGGVGAQAGLFGRSAVVGLFARWVLRSFRESTWLGTPALMRTFAAERAIPGSSRALGWDTMRPTSSCGTLMSRTAIGHTGFTGTSLWIDWERDLYAVLLTNRVHPSRNNERFLPYRARFHDAVMREIRPAI
jgi:CubicO group peptidase (beta-lactamase class C family)